MLAVLLRPGSGGALDACRGRATRTSQPIHLTYDPSSWDPNAGRVYVDGHQVKAGWFRSDDPHQVAVALSDGTRLILMVFPPDTDLEQASWAMRRSVEQGNVLGPGQLLALARLAGGDDGLQRWFGEGGSATQLRASVVTTPAGRRRRTWRGSTVSPGEGGP